MRRIDIALLSLLGATKGKGAEAGAVARCNRLRYCAL